MFHDISIDPVPLIYCEGSTRIREQGRIEKTLTLSLL